MGRTFKIQASICKALAADYAVVLANYAENLVFVLEAAQIATGLEGILRDGRMVNVAHEGAGSRCNNTPTPGG